jgi:hypothetical protein
MLRDYELALSNYRLLSTDYKLDKAWKRFAGVQVLDFFFTLFSFYAGFTCIFVVFLCLTWRIKMMIPKEYPCMLWQLDMLILFSSETVDRAQLLWACLDAAWQAAPWLRCTACPRCVSQALSARVQSKQALCSISNPSISFSICGFKCVARPLQCIGSYASKSF